MICNSESLKDIQDCETLVSVEKVDKTILDYKVRYKLQNRISTFLDFMKISLIVVPWK